MAQGVNEAYGQGLWEDYLSYQQNEWDKEDEE
jgi:hypothetical protein